MPPPGRPCPQGSRGCSPGHVASRLSHWPLGLRLPAAGILGGSKRRALFPFRSLGSALGLPPRLRAAASPAEVHYPEAPAVGLAVGMVMWGCPRLGPSQLVVFPPGVPSAELCPGDTPPLEAARLADRPRLAREVPGGQQSEAGPQPRAPRLSHCLFLCVTRSPRPRTRRSASRRAKAGTCR